MKEEIEHFKNQVYVSVVAWLVIILNATCLYFSLANVVQFYIVLQSSPFDTKDYGMMAAFFYTQDIIQTLLFFTFLLYTFGLVSGIGLLKRKYWGLILYTVVSSLWVILIVGLVIFYRMNANLIFNEIFYNSDAVSEIVQVSEHIKRAKNIEIITYGIFLLIVTRMILKSIFKLNNKKFRRIFH